MKGFQSLLIAEAVVCLAFFYKLLGKGTIGVLSLALHIGSILAADVGTFIMAQSHLFQGIVDHIHSALYQALSIGIFDAQHKGASL